MTFTSALIIVQVLLIASLILFGRKTKFIRAIPMQAKALALLLSLMPIWGVILFIGGCIGIITYDE